MCAYINFTYSQMFSKTSLELIISPQNSHLNFLPDLILLDNFLNKFKSFVVSTKFCKMKYNKK